MTMKLIQKTAPRGALKRWLSEGETAVRNVFGRKQVRSAQERAVAEHVILEMCKSELRLQCSCVAGGAPL